jgi:hypothetical protein
MLDDRAENRCSADWYPQWIGETVGYLFERFADRRMAGP